jgi:hypothetical protein
MRPVVVFDTNILFSGLGWRGKAHQCLMAAREGIVESVTCQEILAELEAVLRLKRNMPEDDIVEAVNEILLFSRVVQIANTLTGVVSDPEDHGVRGCWRRQSYRDRRPPPSAAAGQLSRDCYRKCCRLYGVSCKFMRRVPRMHGSP